MAATPPRWRARVALLGSTVLVTTLVHGFPVPETEAAPPRETMGSAISLAREAQSVAVSAPARSATSDAATETAAPTKAPDRARKRKPQLPLGRKNLPEKRQVRTIDTGVTMTVIRRGKVPRKGQKTERADGPWIVRALTIDPERAQGTLATTYGSTVAGRERTTSLTRQVGALVGVNASFFSMAAEEYRGVPAGLTASDGRVLSEPTGYRGEVTLLVDSARNRLRIGSFTWSARIRNLTTGEQMRVNRVNSPPHVPKGCRTTKAHRLCEKRGQVVAFTPDFARRTPSGLGTEVVLNGRGCPVDIRNQRGTRLKKHQISLQATGRAAVELRDLAGAGCLEQVQHLHDKSGEAVQLDEDVSAVAGRYRLLSAGKIRVPNRSGGLFARHPRTIAGTTDDGKIMLVTIDGRQRQSVGATMREAARVAKALGLRNAVNLDGGGSTTMSIRGKLTNNPAGSERPVSDALVWVARRD